MTASIYPLSGQHSMKLSHSFPYNRLPFLTPFKSRRSFTLKHSLSLNRVSRRRANPPSVGKNLLNNLNTLEAVSMELVRHLEHDLEDLSCVNSSTEIHSNKLQMIESFNQVADVLVRILTKIKRDFQPAQQELQNLETQFQLMNDRVLSMKQTIRNINSDRPREKPRKQNFWNSSIFDDLQCLNDGERSELNWLLSEFLVLMERNEDGGICLMLLLKRIQSIKTNKTGVDRIQLEQLESGPLLQLVNKYSTRFTSNKEASPIHTKEAPLVPKSIKKTEEIPNQVEPTNDGGGGEGGDSDDYGDHGDDSEDDGERSSISFWLVIQCFLFRFFALQYHKNKSHFKSNAKPVVLEKQILDFWKKSKSSFKSMNKTRDSCPPPVHVASSSLSLTRDKHEVQNSRSSSPYVETGAIFVLGVILSKLFNS